MVVQLVWFASDMQCWQLLGLWHSAGHTFADGWTLFVHTLQAKDSVSDTMRSAQDSASQEADRVSAQQQATAS